MLELSLYALINACNQTQLSAYLQASASLMQLGLSCPGLIVKILFSMSEGHAQHSMACLHKVATLSKILMLACAHADILVQIS
jgi:hypothetical protein